MDYFDHIEEYLNKTLSESERLAFERAMEADATLKQAVEDHDAAMDLVGSILEGEIRGVIEEEVIRNEKLINNNGEGEGDGQENVGSRIAEEGGNKTESAVVKRMNWMRWVAAAMVMVVLGWWGVNELSMNRLENEIYSSYYLRPKLDTHRGMPNNSTNLDSIKYFFQLNDFAKSLQVVNNNIDRLDEDSYVFFKAQNLFNLGEFSSLISFIESKGTIESELQEILFYSFILNGQKNKAREYVKNLSKDQQSKVKPLLE